MICSGGRVEWDGPRAPAMSNVHNVILNMYLNE